MIYIIYNTLNKKVDIPVSLLSDQTFTILVSFSGLNKNNNYVLSKLGVCNCIFECTIFDLVVHWNCKSSRKAWLG